jgi:hypothetical protein
MEKAWQICNHCNGSGTLKPKLPKYTQLEIDFLDEMFERRMEDPRA